MWVKSVKLMLFSVLRGMVHTKEVYSNDDQGKVYSNSKCHDLRGRGSGAGAMIRQYMQGKNFNPRRRQYSVYTMMYLMYNVV